jgi:hypothetical protein
MNQASRCVHTGAEEDGETEVDDLELRVLRLVGEEEVLGLEVPVDDPVGVAQAHDIDDGAEDGRRGALRVVPARDDAVEELAALAELHDEVHGAGGVLAAGLAEPHHGAAAAGRHAPHDGHLPLDVRRVRRRCRVLPGCCWGRSGSVVGRTGPQAAGGGSARPAVPPDGLARERLPRGGVPAAARHPELAAPQLPAQHVAARKLGRGGPHHERPGVVLARGRGRGRRMGGDGAGAAVAGAVVAVALGDWEDEGDAAAQLPRAGEGGVAAPHGSGGATSPRRPRRSRACAGTLGLLSCLLCSLCWAVRFAASLGAVPVHGAPATYPNGLFYLWQRRLHASFISGACVRGLCRVPVVMYVLEQKYGWVA